MGAATRRLRFAALFVASCSPVLIDWTAKVLVWPRPFWVYYYDPEAIYFYGGLSMLRGRLPANVDNPGLPLHMLSALLAAITGPAPLRYAQFLAVGHTLGLVLTLAAIALLLLTLFRDAPPMLAIAGAWTFFLAPQALERVDIWSPEILYFPLGAVIVAALWTRHIPAAAFTGGVAVATKWVFAPSIPAIVIAAFAMSGFAAALIAAAAAVIGFLAGILPAILSLQSLLHLVINPNQQSWLMLIATSRAWVAWCFVVIAAAAVTYDRRNRPLLLFACVLIALTLLGASRNPSFRYLLPAAIGVVVLFAVMAASQPRIPLQTAFLLAAALLMTKAIRDDVAAHQSRIAHAASVRAAIARAIPEGANVLYGWRAPVPSFALRIMANDPRDLAAIAKAYPREGAFNPWTGVTSFSPGLRHFDYFVLTPEDLRRFPASTPVAKAGEFVVAPAQDAGVAR
ncbi:MAG TPA: hypothetical protein VF381_16590 [Thermoanaerobaculia bacterium]